MSRRRQLVWAVALTPMVVLLLIVAAWAIDAGAAGGKVLRNVELAGTPVGGMASDDLLLRVQELDKRLGDRTVRVVTPEVAYETTADEIGLMVDEVATADAALDAGRDSLLAWRPFEWLRSFVWPLEVEVRYQVDAETARTTLRRLEGDALVSPVEPTIRSIEGDPFEAVPGRPGTGIDPETLAVALAAAAQDATAVASTEPIIVRIQQSSLDPRLTLRTAEAAARAANALTDDTLSVTAGAETIHLVPRELRRLARVREVEAGIAIALDPEPLLALLAEEFADQEVQAQDAAISVDGDEVVIEPSVTGLECCELAAAEAIDEAFRSGATEVTVELAEIEPEFTTEDAEALGIVEEVGDPDAFGPTTRHRCCEDRVTNIHRIADIVRGAVIEPGETFSINEYVGRRTVEKGFVPGGVIYNGELSEDVGGGVSQFATTLFNAALYAGLDFGEYQSHSLYISRYPRGHEATISYPAPDLEIINATPYGVLIWPEYTDTSLTIRLFSTQHVEVTVGEPTSRRQGNCTRWTTPRTRYYEDGTEKRDSVFAVYRPREGVSC